VRLASDSASAPVPRLKARAHECWPIGYLAIDSNRGDLERRGRRLGCGCRSDRNRGGGNEKCAHAHVPIEGRGTSGGLIERLVWPLDGGYLTLC